MEEVCIGLSTTQSDKYKQQDCKYEHIKISKDESITLLPTEKGLIVMNGIIHDTTTNATNLNTSKPLDLSTSTIMDSSVVFTVAPITDLPLSLTASEHKLDQDKTIMNFQNINQDVTTLTHLSEPDFVKMQDVADQFTITTASGLTTAPGGQLTHNHVIEVLSCDWLNCFLKFTTQEDLVNHVNQCHILLDNATGYCCKWVGCTRNGKKFNAKYKMRIHVRSHTNEKPHECHICKKCFSRSENLKIHKRSHTGEKPYMCPVKGCNKRYSNSSDRFKHSRTHVVDKPYVCKAPDCNKCYTDPSSLRKHARSHNHYISKPENPSSKPVKAVIPDVLLTQDQHIVYPMLLKKLRTPPSLPHILNFPPQYLPVSRMLSVVQGNSPNNILDSTKSHDVLSKTQVMISSKTNNNLESEGQFTKIENASILSTQLAKEQNLLMLNEGDLKLPFIKSEQLQSGHCPALSTVISTLSK
ncbi:uncharacterized protein [Antedon mediterranea]|uniref:uncharacterized protein n=1 Tax=Antedon mediterranea TaxID=105859 RepID=UPI003AF787DD